MMSSVLIVGAGHGGSQLAVSLRQDGFKGSIILIGAEAENPYHRPPLSKAFLKAEEARLQPLRAESFYAANGIDFRPATIARAIDPARGLCQTDGPAIGFDTLVLATGATPRLPDIGGIGLDGVFALRSSDDARRIRAGMPAARDVVVIGGGFIGLEIAATMAAFGKTVTVLEIGDRLLARAVSPIVSAHILSTLRASGVTVRTGMAATVIAGPDRVTGVETTSGEHLAADMVLVGIGAEPNVGLAEGAGLLVDGGIVVDEAMRSSNPAILAIGDCTRFHHWQAARSVRLESVQNATDQARHAARTILGRAEPYRAVPWFWSDIGDVKLQMAGLSFDADRHVTAGSPEEGAFSVYHFRGDKLLAIDSVNRPADHMMGRRMIAAGYDPVWTDVEAGRANDAFKARSAAGSEGAAA